MAEKSAGFLSRWSRLKRQDRERPAAPDPGAPMPVPDDEGSAAIADAQTAEAEANRAAAEAVDLDAMAYGDDFSAFLKRGVPEPLRRRALRKFFNSDPLLANLDGLNDYDDDYNNPAHMVYKSSWDAVRGFLTDEEKAAQQRTGNISSMFDAPPGAETPANENAAAADAGAATEEIAADRLAGAEETAPPAEGASPDSSARDEGHLPADEPVEAGPAEVPLRVSIRRRLDG